MFLNEDCSIKSILEDIKKKPVITMNGHQNFHVGQQIFYLYDEQKLKIRLLSDNEQTKKLKSNNYLIEPGNGTYKLHVRKVSWNNARQACVEEGGNRDICDIINVERALPTVNIIGIYYCLLYRLEN
jgi:hypothetical protein